MNALSISAVSDENAAAAMAQLGNLCNAEMHSSVLLSPVDERVMKKLGVRVTCSPEGNIK